MRRWPCSRAADAAAPLGEGRRRPRPQLHCDGQTSVRGPVRSLEGIQHLSALSDPFPLAGLALFDLGLSQNPVSDLTPLAGTSTLGSLGVVSARVTDLA